MTVTLKCLIPAAHVPAAATTLFTATAKTIIDKFTVSNTGAQTTVEVHIVPAGGSANPSTVVLPAVTIEAGRAYLCAEMVGHILEIGDSIVAEAAVASTISIRASGREVT
jgi:hypothetical protein